MTSSTVGIIAVADRIISAKPNTSRLWLPRAQLADFPTPFFLTDLAIVEAKISTLRSLLPAVGLYYALKSNNDPAVLATVADRVAGFDIASLGELDLLGEFDISTDRINFSNPVKIPGHIAEAYRRGVRTYAVDSFDEIRKLAEHAPGSDVHLRLTVPSKGSTFPLSVKFGLAPDQVEACAVAAQTAGLYVTGLAFHVGSQCENPRLWEAALRLCGTVINQLRHTGIDITTINIGGGFPADYGNESDGDIDGMCQVINDSIAAYLPSGITVIAEPGRFVVAESTAIVCSVIAREERNRAHWLYLDVGAFQGLIEPLEVPTWRYPVFSVTRPDVSTHDTFVLTGPTCDPYDTIGNGYVLPTDTELGHRLCIASAGAYTSVYASHFNGFAPPQRYLV